jgi:hypothetical protein
MQRVLRSLVLAETLRAASAEALVGELGPYHWGMQLLIAIAAASVILVRLCARR